MRSWALTIVLLAACAPDPAIDCRCSSPGVPRESVEGSFVHTLEAIEVLEGDYVPPSLPPAVPALAFASENYLMWTLGTGEDVLVLRASWIDLRPDLAATGGCCPGWDGLALTTPQPPWNERSRVHLDAASELGGAIGRLDPTLTGVEPTFPDTTEIEPLFELDPDGRGFVLRSDYYVLPAGCAAAGCAAVVRLTHHFRRAE
jgi:hypothetical protein